MTTDPILESRARAAQLAARGQRLGYILFGLTIAIFMFGLFTDFSSMVSRLAVIGLVAGSVVLAPAILLAYAVKAAVRDDLEHGREIR